MEWNGYVWCYRRNGQNREHRIIFQLEFFIFWTVLLEYASVKYLLLNPEALEIAQNHYIKKNCFRTIIANTKKSLRLFWGNWLWLLLETLWKNPIDWIRHLLRCYYLDLAHYWCYKELFYLPRQIVSHLCQCCELELIDLIALAAQNRKRAKNIRKNEIKKESKKREVERERENKRIRNNILYFTLSLKNCSKKQRNGKKWVENVLFERQPERWRMKKGKSYIIGSLEQK